MPPPKRMPEQFYYHDNLPLEALQDADPPPLTEKSSSSENKVRQSIVSLTRSSMSSVLCEGESDTATEESKRSPTQPSHESNDNKHRRYCCVPSKIGVVIISLLWIISGLLVGSLILLRPPSSSPLNHWNLDETLARGMVIFLVVAQGIIILGTLCGAVTIICLSTTRLLKVYKYFSFAVPAIQGLCYVVAAILYQDWTEFSILIAIGVVSVCISTYFSMIIRAYVQVQKLKTVFLLAGPVSGEVVIV